MSGRPASWTFTPGEPRLSITLPPAFGGATHDVALEGGYTFEPVTAPVDA